jgi:tRNA modification GTPase
MRDSADIIEQIGIKKTSEAVERADGVIWIIDPRLAIDEQRPPKALITSTIRAALCVNKTDTLEDSQAIVDQVANVFVESTHAENAPALIGISAKTGDGIDELLACIQSWITESGITGSSAVLAINERHHACLTESLKSIESASRALAQGSEVELVAFDTRNAAAALGEIIGESATDDVLGEIFSNFCIGK